jgi:hypothetical protein
LTTKVSPGAALLSKLKSKKKRINKAGIPFTGEDPNNKIDRLMSKQVFGMVLTEPLEIQKIKYKLTYFFQQCQ